MTAEVTDTTNDRDFGSRIANSVARRLVMAPHRHGGQAQYVVAPVPEQFSSRIAEVMDWARRGLARPLSIRVLADRAAMSERTLLRRFQDGVGMTPGAWLERERVVRAQEILESTTLTLGEVAQQCGYRSLETFRVAFKRQLGIPPAAYRQRFGESPRPSPMSPARLRENRPMSPAASHEPTLRPGRRSLPMSAALPNGPTSSQPPTAR